MKKAVLPLIALFIAVLLAFSGCVFPQTEAINAVKSDPAAESFLAANLNAKISARAWSRSESLQKTYELVEKCGPQVNPTDYYYVSFQEGEALLEAWVYPTTKSVACVHRSDDLCVTNGDCEDGLLCTKDECTGIPKACKRERTKECVGGDGCCPTGCTSALDYDCPMDECETDADCDDLDNSTTDSCSGIPRKCGNKAITACATGDNYCPPACNYANDGDCSRAECETDADCDDEDASTTDYCSGDPAICKHKQLGACVSGDGHCPIQCSYVTDSDCTATAGERQRITLECLGVKTTFNAYILKYGSGLKATFNSSATHANNASLNFEEYRHYKYNGKQTGDLGIQSGYSTTIREKVTVNARAVYDNMESESFLYFNLNGLEYAVELLSGIPATAAEHDKANPFVAGNDDKITIFLFGKESLVTKVNQNSKEVEVLTNYMERAVASDGTIKSLEGKKSESYLIKIVRCDESSAVFSLYNGDTRVASQTASVGDTLFPNYLAKAMRLNFLNRDYATQRCDFRYATGDYLEKIYDGKEFPLGSGSGWKSYLTFDNDKLKQIVFRNESIPKEASLKTGESVDILPQGQTLGAGFCSLKFVGLVK